MNKLLTIETTFLFSCLLSTAHASRDMGISSEIRDSGAGFESIIFLVIAVIIAAFISVLFDSAKNKISTIKDNNLYQTGEISPPISTYEEFKITGGRFVWRSKKSIQDLPSDLVSPKHLKIKLWRFSFKKDSSPLPSNWQDLFEVLCVELEESEQRTIDITYNEDTCNSLDIYNGLAHIGNNAFLAIKVFDDVVEFTSDFKNVTTVKKL